MDNKNDWKFYEELEFVGYNASSLEEVERALQLAKDCVKEGVWRKVYFRIIEGSEEGDHMLTLAGERRKTQKELDQEAERDAWQKEYERAKYERLKAKFGGQ